MFGFWYAYYQRVVDDDPTDVAERSQQTDVVVPRSRGRSDPSSVVKMAVEERLRGELRVAGTEVTVRVSDGVVILTGTSAGPTAARAASLVAWTVPGVRDVSNQLRFPRSW